MRLVASAASDRGRRIGRWALLICLLSSADFAIAQEVEITLEPTRRVVARGAAVEVVLTLRNASKNSIMVFQGFSPEDLPAFPDTVLSFEILGPDQEVIQRPVSQESLLKRKRVGRSNFRELPPGWFWGGPFYVNIPPFAYPFERAGTYRLRARVTFRARAWLERFAESPDQDPELSMISRDLLVEGTFASNEVVVEIK